MGTFPTSTCFLCVLHLRDDHQITVEIWLKLWVTCSNTRFLPSNRALQTATNNLNASLHNLQSTKTPTVTTSSHSAYEKPIKPVSSAADQVVL